MNFQFYGLIETAPSCKPRILLKTTKMFPLKNFPLYGTEDSSLNTSSVSSSGCSKMDTEDSSLNASSSPSSSCSNTNTFEKKRKIYKLLTNLNGKGSF